MGQMLLSPNTRGGLLLPDYVDSERGKLIEMIRARLNDKLGYSINRCIEEMCCCEDYAVSRLGDEESAAAIRYQKLTKQYRSVIQSSPIEIFYCGRADQKRVESLLRDALSTLPRGEIDYDIGTDVRLNSLEAAPREYTEPMNVTQAKLVIGWRLGEAMEEPNRLASRRGDGGAESSRAAGVFLASRRLNGVEAVCQCARKAVAVLFCKRDRRRSQGRAARLCGDGI